MKQNISLVAQTESEADGPVHIRGERRLIWAVLERALRDALHPYPRKDKPHGSGECIDRLTQETARAWILSNDKSMGSFLWWAALSEDSTLLVKEIRRALTRKEIAALGHICRYAGGRGANPLNMKAIYKLRRAA